MMDYPNTERLKNMASSPMLFHEALMWLLSARVSCNIKGVTWKERPRYRCDLYFRGKLIGHDTDYEILPALHTAVTQIAENNPDWLEARLSAVVNSAESRQ